MQYVDGNEAPGKILTTDANGNSAWASNSIYTESGEIISQFMRKSEKNTQPHGICLDSKGNIYLAELASPIGNDQKVSKFVRI